jgi:hypothetical protein
MFFQLYLIAKYFIKIVLTASLVGIFWSLKMKIFLNPFDFLSFRHPIMQLKEKNSKFFFWHVHKNECVLRHCATETKVQKKQKKQKKPNLCFSGNAASIVDCNERGEVKLQLLSPPNVGFHYELSFFKSGTTSVSSKEGKVRQFF